MKHSAKKQRRRAKQRRARLAARAESAVVRRTPAWRIFAARLAHAVRSSHLVRGAQTLTLFPQHTETDASVRAQREDLAQIWREVGGYMWAPLRAESARIRANERKK